MYQVIKRDGRRVDFDLARIANAITKAFDATEIPYNTDIINLLALQVTADCLTVLLSMQRWMTVLPIASGLREQQAVPIRRMESLLPSTEKREGIKTS